MHVYSESPTRVYARVDGVLRLAAASGGWKAMQVHFFGLSTKERKYFTIDRQFSTSTFREKRKLIEQYSKKMRYLEAISE